MQLVELITFLSPRIVIIICIINHQLRNDFFSFSLLFFFKSRTLIQTENTLKLAHNKLRIDRFNLAANQNGLWRRDTISFVSIIKIYLYFYSVTWRQVTRLTLTLSSNRSSIQFLVLKIRAVTSDTIVSMQHLSFRDCTLRFFFNYSRLENKVLSFFFFFLFLANK